MDPEVAEEFEREVEFMRMTRHTNIVRFFGAGAFPSGTPFLVEELMAGSLQACLYDGVAGACKPLAWDMRYRLARDIAAGMAHIHQLGHMHRDLKSANVLVTERMLAKIADFGSIRGLLVQKTPASAKTSGGWSKSSSNGANRDRKNAATDRSPQMSMTQWAGTPLYMSLEAIAGQVYGPTADVWSYGVVLWELAAQREPDILAQESLFQGPVLGGMQILLESGKRLAIDPAWPEDFKALVSSCWLQDPEARPSFVAVIDCLTAHEGATQTAAMAIDVTQL